MERDGRRVAARSRIQTAHVSWRKPVVGMTTTVVVNCHMRRMSAKRKKGFAAGYTTFFDTLAEDILYVTARPLLPRRGSRRRALLPGEQGQMANR